MIIKLKISPKVGLPARAFVPKSTICLAVCYHLLLSTNLWLTVYGIHLIYMDVLKILKKVFDEVFPQKKVLCSNRFLLQMAYLKENKNLKN